MPELPEVETVVRDLRPQIEGRKIVQIWSGEQKLRHPWQPDWTAALNGQTINALSRRGKWILTRLTHSGLLVHLGMTGQWTWNKPGLPRQSHTHVVITLENGSELRFRDIRRFGSMQYFPAYSDLCSFVESKLGPEPWDMLPEDFASVVRASRRVIKAILLDQSVIAGVGNIYADESLHLARLHPESPGHSLSPTQCQRLLKSIRQVLEKAISGRGSTIQNYVGGSGLMGEFQLQLAVYGRDGEPCRTCAQTIHCIRLAGRSSHFCPKCQKSAT